MRHPKIYRLAILALVIGLAAGPAGCVLHQNPGKALSVADKWFMDNQTRYNDYYDMQPSATQARLKAQVDPIWTLGYATLYSAHLFLASDIKATQKLEEFRSIKDRLITILLTYGFKMEK